MKKNISQYIFLPNPKPITEYTGIIQYNGEPKIHNVTVRWCGGCGEVWSESHFGCCGPGTSTVSFSGDHECPKTGVKFNNIPLM